jgi:lysophospholipase L1-like esterase
MDGTDPPEAPQGALPRSRWRGRLALAVFALLLLACAGEGAARLLAKPPVPPLWSEHSLCFAVQASGAQVVRVLSETQRFDYATDRSGFRGKSLEGGPRPKDAYRIFFLGDEAMLAESLPEEQTFPALVETALNQRRAVEDLRVEAANGAVPGSFAAPIRATLEARVLPLEPDMVVVMTAQNDVRAALASGWDEEGTAFTRGAPRPAFLDWLASVSELVRIARDRADPPALRRAPSALERLGPRDPAADPARALPAYRRELRLMAAACSVAKAELVLVTQPTLYKATLTPEEKAHLPHGPDEALRRGIELYNEAVRSEAARTGARLVDLAQLMACDLDHLRDDVALTPAAHEVAARIFLEEVFKDKAAARHP